MQSLLSDGSPGGSLAGIVAGDTETRAIEAAFHRVPLRRENGASIVGRRTVRAASAIAEAVFARGGHSPPADRLVWLEREFEDFLARSGPRTRVVLSLMVHVVSRAAPLFIGRVARLGSLPVRMRVQALLRLEAHFGAPLLAVKALLCLLYYEHPDAAREAGIDGECLVPREPRGNFEVRS
jgi:hypothetical protein